MILGHTQICQKSAQKRLNKRSHQHFCFPSQSDPSFCGKSTTARILTIKFFNGARSTLTCHALHSIHAASLQLHAPTRAQTHVHRNLETVFLTSRDTACRAAVFQWTVSFLEIQEFPQSHKQKDALSDPNTFNTSYATP